MTGLLRQGAAVAVLDRNESGAKAVTDEGQRNGGNAVAFIVDLADTKQIPMIVDRVIRQFGRIDILVNCAGVAGNRQSLVDLEEAEWDFIHTVNLKASMLMMRYVARHIIDRGGGGRIVNLSSSSAFRARQSAIAYATSKAAIVQLTRSAAAELGRYNINVNAIAPGITDTAMTRAIRDAEGSGRLRRRVRWKTYSIAYRCRRMWRRRSSFYVCQAAGRLLPRRSIPVPAR